MHDIVECSDAGCLFIVSVFHSWNSHHQMFVVAFINGQNNYVCARVRVAFEQQRRRTMREREMRKVKKTLNCTFACINGALETSSSYAIHSIVAVSLLSSRLCHLSVRVLVPNIYANVFVQITSTQMRVTCECVFVCHH